MDGTVVVANDFDQMRWIGGASCSLHCFSTTGGMPSGPGAALGLISSIASMISAIVKLVSSSD